ALPLLLLSLSSPPPSSSDRPGRASAFSPPNACPLVRRLRPLDRREPPTSVAAPPPVAALHSGTGVANSYSWREEQFEIEVKVVVPPGTTASDVTFRCSSDSVDLRLKGDDAILLDGARKTRGKICVDGTFWSIEGRVDITVAIEKHFVPVSSAGGVQTYDTLTDFDWGGLYPNDDDEVTSREYDEPEELDVREYAKELGVDIDNIDMSKVNKTMFGAGLGGGSAEAEGGDEGGVGSEESEGEGFRFDIEQATLDQLTRAGMAKEVVRQGDGSEFELGPDGRLDEERTFSMLGNDISMEELREARIVADNVPPMWEQRTVPVEEAPGYQKTYDVSNSAPEGILEAEMVEREIVSDEGASKGSEISGKANDAAAGRGGNPTARSDAVLNVSDAATRATEEEKESNEGQPKDPIDMLTVAKLKEILRKQGLKVSGTKQVLRDRLREHVSDLLQEE
ncbi:hypothetical protein ACHAWF_001903, partial [Thalassiosira exigua]